MPIAYVTGATGFLGGNVVRRLSDNGWDVVVLRRTEPGENEAKLPYQLGDVTDYDRVEASIPKDCDAVFHVAADTAHWKGASKQQNLVNVIGTRNVARASIARGVKKFIHCSSDAVWGLRTPVLREDVPRLGCEEPINYQRSKFWAEEEIRCAIDQGLDAVMVNPTNIMGPGDLKGWSSVAIQIAQGKRKVAPPGSGAFVYSEDVADAMIAAVERGRIGHNYLLGGVNATYQEFMQLCAVKLGMPFADVPEDGEEMIRRAIYAEAEAEITNTRPAKHLTLDYALVFCAKLAVDSSKAEKELGFRVRPLDELLDLTIKALRDVKAID